MKTNNIHRMSISNWRRNSLQPGSGVLKIVM